MNKLSVNIFLSASLGLFMYTSVSAFEAEAPVNPFKQSHTINSSKSMPAVPAGHPDVNNGAIKSAAEKKTSTGKVLEISHGDNFSYINVESNEQKIWIAGIQVKAAVGDTISYVENVTMDNFTSKVLKRTFKQVVFVSGVSIVK